MAAPTDEKALQRGIGREVRRGKKPAQTQSEAQNLLEEFTTEYEAVSSVNAEGRAGKDSFRHLDGV